MRTNNSKAIKAMAELIMEHMGNASEVKHYAENFPFEQDYNIYTYGNLDVYDYDLFVTLERIGIDTKPVLEFRKVLNGGCTYMNRENLRNTYKALVRKAADYILQNN